MRNFMEIVLRFWLVSRIPQGALRSRWWKETLSWDAWVELSEIQPLQLQDVDQSQLFHWSNWGSIYMKLQCLESIEAPFTWTSSPYASSQFCPIIYSSFASSQLTNKTLIVHTQFPVLCHKMWHKYTACCLHILITFFVFTRNTLPFKYICTDSSPVLETSPVTKTSLWALFVYCH